MQDDYTWFFGIQESGLPGKLVVRMGVAYRNEYDEYVPCEYEEISCEDIPKYILPSLRRLHRLLEEERARYVCLEQLHLLAGGI